MKFITTLLLFVGIAFSQGSGSYSETAKITTANSMATDAFGRWRVSFPVTQFDALNQYNSSPLFWQDSLADDSDTEYVFNGSSVMLTTVGSGPGLAIRQTRQYHRYQSGKSLLVLITVIPHLGDGDNIKMWGYYDGKDGIFFRKYNGVFYVGKRSSRSGSVVDSLVAQSSFNMDKLDGTGPSSFRLKAYNAQVFFIDIAWLGVSRVRLGVINERGEAIVCHEFQNANNNQGVYMRTANLPVRYEMQANGATPDTLTAICASVQSEAGDENENGINTLVGYGVVATSVSTTFTPIISIQPKLTFFGYTNRALIKDIIASLLVTTSNVEYRLVYDGVLTGASWNSAGTLSTVNYDTSATAISGGLDIGGDFVAAGGVGVSAFSSSAATSLLSKLPFTLDMAGATPKRITLVARALSGTASVYAHIKFKEIY